MSAAAISTAPPISNAARTTGAASGDDVLNEFVGPSAAESPIPTGSAGKPTASAVRTAAARRLVTSRIPTASAQTAKCAARTWASPSMPTPGMLASTLLALRTIPRSVEPRPLCAGEPASVLPTAPPPHVATPTTAAAASALECAALGMRAATKTRSARQGMPAWPVRMASTRAIPELACFDLWCPPSVAVPRRSAAPVPSAPLPAKGAPAAQTQTVARAVARVRAASTALAPDNAALLRPIPRSRLQTDRSRSFQIR